MSPRDKRPATHEANSRKGGFEGNYAKDVTRLMRQWQGLAREDAMGILFKEDRYILRDVHARPVDPFALDRLPTGPLITPRRGRVDWQRVMPFWRK